MVDQIFGYHSLYLTVETPLVVYQAKMAALHDGKQSVSGRENTALSGVFCARRDCKNHLAVQKMNI